MSRFIRRFSRGQEGLSLLELTVVAAIISILAALTAVAVTGVSTSTRGTVRDSDMTEVSKAVEAFVGAQAASQYPTTSSCKAGQIPNSVTSVCATGGVEDTDWDTISEVTYGVDINLDGDATDTTLKVVAISWTKDVGDGRTFSPDFATKPKHADETVAGTIAAWVANENGKAVVLIPDGEY